MEPVSPVILVDTDILVDVLRGDGNALERIDREGAGGLSVSEVTQMELIVGCRDTRELALLTRFLDRFKTVHLTAQASARAVGLVTEYRLSHGLRMPDALIAATALDGNLPLLSKNQKDYRFIAGLRLLAYPS